MQLHWEEFYASLSIMGMGMLGVFTVTILIILLVCLLQKLSGKS